MALLFPIDGGTVTQNFGPSAIGAEPPMYTDDARAWWNFFQGAKFYYHYHAALDIAAPAGTPIKAAEAGVVVESYFDSTNGGGHKVRIQIRPGVYYCSNHMMSRKVTVGQKVSRGQVIGYVGSTGYSTGPHDHWWVGIDDEIGDKTWPTLYNPRLFLPGGRLQSDPRIQPVSSIRYMAVNGPGINIRTTPDLDVGSSNIYAYSQADGIYRASTRTRIGALSYKFKYLEKFIRNDDGDWVEVYGFQKKLYIYRSLVHFV